MAKGEIKFRLVAESAQFTGALKQVQGQLNSLQSDLAGKLGGAGQALGALGPYGLAAAAGIGAATAAIAGTAKVLADATREAVAYGGTIQDLSDSSDIGAVALQRLAAAGKPSATSINDIAVAIKKLEQNLTNAPSKFEQLGLSAAKLKAMKPDEAFAKVAEAIGQLGTQSEKTAASMALFGKAFDLKLLATDLDAVADRAESLGQVMSADMIAGLDAVGDEAGVLQDTWKHLWLNIGAAIATTPGLLDALKGVTAALGDMSKWVIDNRDAIQGFTQIAVIPAIRALEHFIRLAQKLAGVVKVENLQSFAEAIGGPVGGLVSDALGALSAPIPGSGISNTPTRAGRKPGEMPTWTSEDAKKAIEEHKKYLAEVERGIIANFDAMAARRADDDAAELADALEKAAAEAAAVTEDELAVAADHAGNAAAAAANDASEATAEAQQRTMDWSKALGDVAHAFEVLGISADSSLGRVLGGITAGMAALESLKKGLATGGGGLGGFFKGGLGNVLGNVTAGLGLASAALGIGKAIVGLFKSDPIKKAQKQAGQILGVGISRELAEAISKQAKGLGISVGNASLLNISKAMAESGKDARSFSGQITQLMQAIKSGAVPAAEGVAQLGESFNAVAEAALKAGSVGDRALVALIRQSRELGIDSPEIKAFVGEQLGRAAGGVGAMQGIKANTIQDAQAQATIFSAAFWATVKEQGIVGAGDAFKESFAKLSESLAAGGFDVSAILGPIGDIIGLSANEVFRGAVEGAHGLREALEGISNAGYLTADSFGAFQQQAAAAYEQAIAGGASSAQALQAIAPLLQSLQSAAANYGLNLDESTLAMIEQAKASGVAFKTEPLDRMAAGIDRLVFAMEKLAGVTHEVAGGFNAIGDTVDGVRPGSGMPMRGEIEGFADGGYVPPRPGGTIVRVGEAGQGEWITPDGAANGGGGRNGTVTINAPFSIQIPPGSNLDPAAVARAVVEGLRNNLEGLRYAVAGA